MNDLVIIVGIVALLAIGGAACGNDDPSNGEIEIAQRRRLDDVGRRDGRGVAGVDEGRRDLGGEHKRIPPAGEPDATQKRRPRMAMIGAVARRHDRDHGIDRIDERLMELMAAMVRRLEHVSVESKCGVRRREQMPRAPDVEVAGEERAHESVGQAKDE